MTFTDDGERVYRAMLADASLGVPELADQLNLSEQRVRVALDELVDQSLLHPDAGDPLSLRPTHPRVGMANLLAEAESAVIAQQQRVLALRSLVDSFTAEHEATLNRESLIQHVSLDAIRSRLEVLSKEAASECLSLNPGRAHDAEAMAASKPLNESALRRGVAIRCVYQESCRNDQPTLAYARWLTDHGGLARTVPTVPILMIIIDRETALLPRVIDDGSQGGLEVRAPSVVRALLEYFEAVWSMADPMGHRPMKDDEALTSATKRELLQTLAQGATDEASARRLGVSTRTVRRVMAELMNELGATSRFQAAVEATRRGWIR